MSLTYDNLVSVIQAVTNAVAAPSGIGDALILNSAGEHLFNMHPWNFREGASTTLKFVPEQNYVELPIDFGGVTAYAMASTQQAFEFTTPQILAELIDSSVSATGYRWWGAIVQPAAPTAKQALPNKQIDIYPTPASVATLRLWYRRGWVTMVSGDIAQIPTFVEPLYVELVKAFALCHWANQGGSPNFGVYENLAAVENSPLFHACALRDGMDQPDYGFLEGGAIAQGNQMSSWRSRTSGAVADPS